MVATEWESRRDAKHNVRKFSKIFLWSFSLKRYIFGHSRILSDIFVERYIFGTFSLKNIGVGFVAFVKILFFIVLYCSLFGGCARERYDESCT